MNEIIRFYFFFELLKNMFRFNLFPMPKASYVYRISIPLVFFDSFGVAHAENVSIFYKH